MVVHRLPLLAVSRALLLLGVGFSPQWLTLLQSTGSKSMASVAVAVGPEQGLWWWHIGQVLPGTWSLPGPGMESVPPALAGGFLSSALPGKSTTVVL